MSIVITKQPVSVTVKEKASAVFSVEATGDGLMYQWKYSSNGRSWSNSPLASAKKSTLTMTATTNRNGYHFRCVITDANGDSVTSDTAILTVLYISISKQPTSVEAEAGTQAVFAVTAKGDGLTYQWQCKEAGMANYADIFLEGYDTSSLTVDVTPERDGAQYRCVIRDNVGNEKTSSAATLTVKTGAVITKQPGNIAAAAGNTVIFSVEATGAVGYQWQVSGEEGAEWQDLTWEDADKALMIHKIAETDMQYQYRCRLTAEDGSEVYTDAVVFVEPVIIISAQPASATAPSGSDIDFTVIAAGDGLMYQWQRRLPGGAWEAMTAEGCDGPTLTVAAEETLNGCEYRCLLTDAGGNRIITDAAVMTVLGKAGGCAAVGGDRMVVVTWNAAMNAADYLVYRAMDGEEEYSLISEVTGLEYEDSGLQVGANCSYKIRSRDTEGILGEFSDAAEAMVYGVEITLQPQDVVVETSAAFTVGAVGDGLTYQWQRRAAEADAWIAIGDGATLVVAAEREYHGCEYRCVITDSKGYSGISEAAKMRAAEKIWSDAPRITAAWTGENEISVSWKPAIAADAYRVAEVTDGAYTNVRLIGDGGRTVVFSDLGSGVHEFAVQPCLYLDGAEILGEYCEAVGTMIPEAYLESPWAMLPDAWQGRKLAVSFMARSEDWSEVDGVSVDVSIGTDGDPRAASFQNMVIGSGGALKANGDVPGNGRWARIWAAYELRGDAFLGDIDDVVAGKLRLRICAAGGEVQICKVKAEWGGMATDWSPAPEDTEDELDAMAKEVKEAKLLITPEAIISTVTQTTQWQEQESRIEQNADQIALRVTTEQFDSMKVGGRNYLKDSDVPVSGTAYYLGRYYFGSEVPKAGDICTARIWGTVGTGDAPLFTVYAVDSSGTTHTFGDATRREDGTFVYTGPWPADNVDSLRLHCVPYSLTTASRVDRVKLEMGDRATDWTPHWEEFRAGSSIVMTEDEVKIATAEFNVNIVGDDGETNMLSMDEEGAQMTSLSAPNVAVRYDGPDTVYVIPDGEAAEDCYRSLGDVFAMLSGKHIDRPLNVYIAAGSTQYVNAALSGTTGGAQINVHAYYGDGMGGGNAKIVGSLVFNHIATPVHLQSIDVDTGVGSYAIRAIGPTTHVTVAMCVMRSTSNSGNVGFMAENGAAGYLGVCEFYGLKNSMLARNGGVITAMNCAGDCSVRAERGMMFLTGTMPSAAGAWGSTAYSELGGKVFFESADANNAVSVDKGSSSSGSAVTAPTTVTVAATGVGAYSGSWRSDGVMRQGMYNGSEYAGCMWFDRSGFIGRSIKSASMTLKRLSGSGRSRPVALYLYTTTLSSASGNPLSGRVSYDKLGEIAQGETKTFTLPVGAAQALANGTAKGLMLYAADGAHISGRDYSENYCKIGSAGDELPVLTVNY